MTVGDGRNEDASSQDSGAGAGGSGPLTRVVSSWYGGGRATGTYHVYEVSTGCVRVEVEIWI